MKGFWILEKRAVIFTVPMILGLMFTVNATAEDFYQSTATISQDFSSSKWDDFDEDWDWDDCDDDRTQFDFRYNRVQGLYLGMKLNPEPVRERYPDRTLLYGFAGYSFSSEMLEYQAGIEKGIFDDFRFALGAEYHNFIDTPDRWVIPDDENSVAALFLKEDFQDFYSREGSSVYLSQNFTHDAVFKLGYHIDNLDSLERNASWALFGGDKKFPHNPAMDQGESRSVIASFELDTRNSKTETTRGWFVRFEYEKADPEWHGDFEFDRAFLDFRRFQPFGNGDGVDLRFAGGTGTTYMPWNRRFYLGGLSTLRGFSHKAFPNGRFESGGNRMLLGQIEYRLGDQNMLLEDTGLDFLDAFQIVLFADAGWVWNYASDDLWDGFDDLEWSTFKSDVGLALTNHGGNVRLEIARRTDTGEKPYTVWFRINRPF